MKFVLAYTNREGSTPENNLKALESAQKLLANWTPSPNADIKEWVQRCDGTGGFAVIEGDNMTDLYRDLATWSPWLKFEVVPVLDIMQATPITEEAIHTASAVL
ncbi:MAG TPA: DUF3303 family protein [Acidimicrobiales bacterium]|nr:DUF3303 family protein [Acidimicrobiales bacterium]